MTTHPEPLAAFLRTLGDPHRLRIISLLNPARFTTSASWRPRLEIRGTDRRPSPVEAVRDGAGQCPSIPAMSVSTDWMRKP